MEKRLCQNCKAEFTIEPEDFDFYNKIKVPPPTWCPDCRMMRRMSFRNERTLHKRKCDLCGKSTVSVYSEKSPFIVYCYDCFYSDKWDVLASGASYDFSKPFFKQFKELQLRAPKLAAQKSNDLVNSEYGNHIGALKDCYMLFASVGNEDCMYCNYVSKSKRVVDSLRVFKGENCYDCIDCMSSTNLLWCQQCQDSFDGYFLYNCRGCSNCFLCTNLINQSYCIRNRQYSKEEYKKLFSELFPKDRASLNVRREEFSALKKEAIRRCVEGVNYVASSGNYLRNTKNCKKCFDLADGENCKFVGYGNNIKDSYDAYSTYPTSELCYETVGSGNPAYNAKFTYLPWQGSDFQYCINPFPGCSNCFGCAHIRNKQYCILNKQYTKEEYEALVPKIIKHMDEMPYTDKVGRVFKYGEFFPPELSPFGYNETIAQEHFPLTKEEVEEKKFIWREPDLRDYTPTKKAEEIPDSIKEVGDNIIQEVIQCAHAGRCVHQCTTAFRIVPSELAFYRQMNFPLPQLCPNCRHGERFALRSPLKLWHRSCMCDGSTSSPQAGSHGHEGKCKNEFETSYAPERPEIVYCEKCYQSEVV